MYVFVVWKTSISGWSKEILAVFDSEKKPESTFKHSRESRSMNLILKKYLLVSHTFFIWIIEPFLNG